MITATSLTGKRFTARGLTGRGLSGFSLRDLFNGFDGAWYNPFANTQFTTEGGSTLSGNGDPVGDFNDSSGSGFDAVQPTSGSRPAKIIEDGIEFLRYNGTSQWLDTGVERMGNTGLFCGPGERFFVAFAFRPTGALAFKTLIARAANTVGERTIHLDVTDVNSLRIVLRGASTNVIPVTNDEWVVGLINWDGSAATALINGVTSPLTVGDAAELTGQRITIGCRTASSPLFFFNGDIGTLLIRDYDLTPAQKTQVMNKLAAQVGVTL